jgi:hypothetical protein
MWTSLLTLWSCTDTGPGTLRILQADDPGPPVGETPPAPTDASTASSDAPGDSQATEDAGTEGGDLADGKAPPSCTPSGEVLTTGRLPPGLDEVSGMVVSKKNPGIAWVVEDSGNEADVYAITSAGTLVAAVQLDVPNRDFEDLAIAPCGVETCVWVADTGDNASARDHVVLYRFVEPVLGSDFDYRARPDAFAFRYPAGARNVEALAVTSTGQPYVLTKREDGTTEVYSVPLDAQGVSEAELVAVIVTTVGMDLDLDEAKVTGAALWPDDRALLVRSYGALWMFDLAGGWASLSQAARLSLPVASEPQGEVVAWDAAAHGYWTTSEGVKQPLHFASCGA